MIRKHLIGALLVAVIPSGYSDVDASSRDPGGTTALPATSSEGGQPDEPVEIQVLYGRNSEQLAIFVAKEAGLFEEHGLSVILAETGGAATITPAIAGGTGDMGLSTAPDFLLAVQGGLDLVIVAGSSVNTPENPRLFVLAGRDSGITSPTDLAGTRVGLPSRGSFAEFGPAIMLERAGVDPDSIEWVEIPFFEMNDALDAGRIDAAVAVVPFSTQMERSGHTLLLDVSEVAESLPLAFLSARREWAEANQEAILEFRAALQDAVELIETDPDFAKQVEAQYTGLPPDVLANSGFSTYRAEMTTEELQVWIDILEEGDDIEPGLDPADLIVPAASEDQ